MDHHVVDRGVRGARTLLKTGKARAIRFSTLSAICRELECQPGEILAWEQGPEPADNGA
jgi:putative transcriptional regulator